MMMWNNPFDESSKILIEPQVIALICGYCQDQTASLEAGGILLGYRREGHIHIVKATIPQFDDRRMRFRFHRRDRNHQKVATLQWTLSGNTMDYVGEWHTHPEIEPTPSPLDMSEWQKICDIRQASMVFLIVGWIGALWLGVSHGQQIIRAIEVS